MESLEVRRVHLDSGGQVKHLLVHCHNGYLFERREKAEKAEVRRWSVKGGAMQK